MADPKVSVILFHSDDEQLYTGLRSIFAQTNLELEVIIISEAISESNSGQIKQMNDASLPVHFVETKAESIAGKLNPAFKKAAAPFILYMDNHDCEISLKQGAVDLFLLTMNHHDNCGFIYADYELVENNATKEIHLLKHHIGRLRDNQDYGRVYFMKKEILQQFGYADEDVKFNTWYDLRLKFSQKSELLHVANRYAGSLYRVISTSKAHDVFDYLKAGKEVQVEAEDVITNHLKQINAYLAPGAHYKPLPDFEKNAELKASVIIPVNDRPEFIGVAIESVQAQTVQEVEVIVVVNGGPDDPTVKEVKRYMSGGDKYNADKPRVQLLVYDINNLGLCLNMGAHHARGAYYVQLDSDDRLKPDAVEKILQVYESDPKIGMVIGSYEVWQLEANGDYNRMEDLPVVTHDEWTEENGRNNLLRINGAGAPRSIPIRLIKNIGFSVNEEPFCRNYGEDYHMVLQISEQHRIGRVWDAIYEVVRHSGGTDHSIDQVTIDRNDEAKDYMRAEAVKRRIRLNKG